MARVEPRGAHRSRDRFGRPADVSVRPRRGTAGAPVTWPRAATELAAAASVSRLPRFGSPRSERTVAGRFQLRRGCASGRRDMSSGISSLPSSRPAVPAPAPGSHEPSCHIAGLAPVETWLDRSGSEAVKGGGGGPLPFEPGIVDPDRPLVARPGEPAIPRAWSACRATFPGTCREREPAIPRAWSAWPRRLIP